ncbi:MAG: Phosphoenolpyruvate synthase, partial [uncultured Friedmanniella sp.]
GRGGGCVPSAVGGARGNPGPGGGRRVRDAGRRGAQPISAPPGVGRCPAHRSHRGVSPAADRGGADRGHRRQQRHGHGPGQGDSGTGRVRPAGGWRRAGLPVHKSGMDAAVPACRRSRGRLRWSRLTRRDRRPGVRHPSRHGHRHRNQRPHRRPTRHRRRRPRAGHRRATRGPAAM